MKHVVGSDDPDLLLDAEEFARRRGWSDESLIKACKAHRVFCLVSEGVALYPAFFVDPHYNVRQLEAVSRQLGALPGGSKWQFFVTGKGSLGGLTPLQALVAGNYAAVVRAAQGFLER